MNEWSTVTIALIKIVTNKDENGNPKNYNLEIKLSVGIVSEGGQIINKIFSRTVSLTAKNKKIEERQIEINIEKIFQKHLVKT
mgnify:CR=1 FL=1